MNIKNRIFTILTFISLFSLLLSCSKSSDPKPAAEVDRTGNYYGTLTVYSGGMLLSTLNNMQVTIVGTSTKGQVSIITGVSSTPLANISGNTLTIPKTVSTQVPSMSLTEYGNGTFNGTTLTLEINHELKTNGALSGLVKYSFVVKK